MTERIITTAGSVSPDQLIAQGGDAANGSYHLVFFTPWFPDAVKNSTSPSVHVRLESRQL